METGSVKRTENKALLVLLAGLVVGWSAPPPAEFKDSSLVAAASAGLTQARVLAIARQAVGTNDTWLDRVEFETAGRRPDGTWSVMVWRLPKTPGGHRVIMIAQKGKVKRYFRGA